MPAINAESICSDGRVWTNEVLDAALLCRKDQGTRVVASERRQISTRAALKFEILARVQYWSTWRLKSLLSNVCTCTSGFYHRLLHR